MTWASAGSAIFQQAMLNPITLGVKTNSGSGIPTSYGATGLLGDAVKVAVFNNTTAPNKADIVANTGFNTGQWVTANEITGTGWASGGVSVGTTKTWTVDSGSSSLCYQVTAPTAGQTSTTGVTLAGFFGALVYDSTITAGTVAAQGLCFNYFGGSQSVTAATFTIVWATPASSAVTAIFNISV
jgi:hypothetical protein